MRVYRKRLQQIWSQGDNPRMCVVIGEEMRCSQKSTWVHGSQTDASRHRTSPSHCSYHNMAEVRFSDVSSRKGKEISMIFQIVSFMVFAGTQPTTANELFSKVILWHHPQKHLGKSLPKLTWESNRRNWMQPCKTRPSHFVSSISSQMAAMEEMTAYRKQSSQELIQPLGWK